MRTYKAYILYGIFGWIIKQFTLGFHSCGNKFEQNFTVGNIYVKVIRGHKDEDIIYSREELLEMLTIIRKEEKRQGWKVPEPIIKGKD